MPGVHKALAKAELARMGRPIDKGSVKLTVRISAKNHKLLKRLAHWTPASEAEIVDTALPAELERRMAIYWRATGHQPPELD